MLVGGPRLLTGDAEVRHLVGQYPDAVVLADGDATADRVMAAMDGAWLVHMAAHGTFRGDSPLFSAIELADGPLTVYDLERLKQAPYRVVLSSCSSAVGVTVGADELLGLVSALISLGSAGVVASVVPVNDPATVPLMTALHEHLRAGTDLAGALTLARHAIGDDPVAQATALLLHRAGDLTRRGRGHRHIQSVTSRPAGVSHRSRTRPRGMPASVEEADVVGLDPEAGPVRGLHQDLPRPGRDDLADHVAGHHLKLQGQWRRRENQDTRLARVRRACHRTDSREESKLRQAGDRRADGRISDLAPGGTCRGDHASVESGKSPTYISAPRVGRC